MAWHRKEWPRSVATTHGKPCRWLLLAGSGVLLCFTALWSSSARGEEPAVGEPVAATALQQVDAKQAQGEQANERAAPAEVNIFLVDGEQDVQINGVVVQLNNAALQLNLIPQFGIGGGVNYVEQFRPLLISELAFVRQICVDMTIDQRRTIKIAGELALRDAARQMAEIQPVENAWDDSKDAEHFVDAVALIRDGLAKAICETLPADQAERFAAESAQRLAQRKRASILIFVAKLDRIVYLTREQRAAVAASLSANWQTKWEIWYRVLADDQPSLPPVPDALLECLSGVQWAVWKSVPTTDPGLNSLSVSAPDEDDGAWWGGNPGALVTLLFEILEISWQAFARPR